MISQKALYLYGQDNALLLNYNLNFQLASHYKTRRPYGQLEFNQGKRLLVPRFFPDSKGIPIRRAWRCNWQDIDLDGYSRHLFFSLHFMRIL